MPTAGDWNYGGKKSVRVALAGDAGTGKSSLVVAAATAAAAESFPDGPPAVLPPARLPLEFFEGVPITAVDTSSRPEHRDNLIAECRAADVVMLTYACDRPETLERLRTYWLPELHRLQVNVPVILVGCKLDLRRHEEFIFDQVMAPIMEEFRCVETFIECSALWQIQIPEVFFYAQKAVVHPTAPLYDQETALLKPKCIRALKRIFILCDHDRDGALSDAELNDFQVRCFNVPLQSSEIVTVKRAVQDQVPEGVNNNGLTLTGFLFLHALLIQSGRLETTWTVLRKFGYDNDIKLRVGLLPTEFKRTPDQTVELTNEIVGFLKGIFSTFDMDSDGALLQEELVDLFSTAPDSNPWSGGPYEDSAATNFFGGLTHAGFISQWALMTRLDPANALANLVYIGYTGDPASVFQITRKRRLDRKKQHSERNVFQCYVFGPKNAGKSKLLDTFIQRSYDDIYTPTTRFRYAANVLETEGAQKTLILVEVPEDEIHTILSNKELLADCDVAVFMHDSSDESSWRRAKELLVKVATHGENNGFVVPCLLVSSKDDLDPCQMAILDSTRVSQDMGMEPPVPVSMKLRDTNNVFLRIVHAAQHPHLSIPETEAGKSRKRYRHIVNRSLMVVSVGAAIAVVGLAAYRVYAARKNTS